MSQADEVCPLKVLVRADLHLSQVQGFGPFHPGLWCLYQGIPRHSGQLELCFLERGVSRNWPLPGQRWTMGTTTTTPRLLFVV